MRAFTSLVGHILGSHAQINGYYEMHISYVNASSLDKQLEELENNDEFKSNGNYLFDKLLHNDYELNLKLSELNDAKILVALRDPEQTIKSIVDLFSKKEIDDLYAQPFEAVKYYIERLEKLTEFCNTFPQRYYYFASELIQTEPNLVLPKLTSWLELDVPLSGEYRLFSQTGKQGKGDSSDLIKSGKIIKETSDYPDINIPEQELNKANEVYKQCREVMIRNTIEELT